MLRETRFFSASLVVLLTVVTLASLGFAQVVPAAVGADGGEPSATDLAANEKRLSQWRDMLHYVQLARADLATSFAEAVLAEAKPEQIYMLSVEVKGSQVILTRAMGVEKLAPIVKKIRAKIDEGYQLYRSDAKEIQRMIDLLGGNPRQYMRASKRLAASGEYALPQMIAVLLDPKTSAVVREKISTVLPMGKKGNVRGLTEALIGTQNERLIQVLAAALGNIEYPHSVPHLKEVSLRKDLTEATRRIVIAAMVRCSDGDRGVVKKALSELYYKNALKYYYRHDSVLADERFDTANVWAFKDGVLTYTAVPRAIFCDVYAMRMARKTLQANQKYSPAVSLWLGAFLRREADLPEGAVDPLVAEGQAKAGDYTRAAGCDYAQQVLARAIRDGDTAVALGAIAALRDVAGAKNLPKIIDVGTVQPLVAAMSYSDRRVRFLAAEVLAHALPTEPYTGYQVVVPVLSDALRTGGLQRALVLADGTALNVVTDALRSKSFKVVSASDSLSAIKAARDAGGVDVIVVAKTQLASRMLSMVRRDAGMAPTPTIILGGGSKLAKLVQDDKKALLVPADKTGEALVAALPEAAKLAAGKPLTPEESSDWSIRAAKAIRLLGITGNKVYNIVQTEKALIEVMADKRITVSIAAANALTAIPGPVAQQALASQAAQGEAAAEIRVAAYKALAESVRRFGNQLTKAQSQAVVDLVNSKTDIAIRQAAAGALGALNLPSDLASPLILEAGGID
ncbi:MAG: hypothetical protein HN350_02185 [Phycisphaerales bacterium]|jgi:hypothetical protein|nr:hypothetical protein [Phycisphaerales bacterium]